MGCREGVLKLKHLWLVWTCNHTPHSVNLNLCSDNNSGIKYRILGKPYSLFPILGVKVDGLCQIGNVMKGRRLLGWLIVLGLGRLNPKKPMYNGQFSVLVFILTFGNWELKLCSLIYFTYIVYLVIEASTFSTSLLALCESILLSPRLHFYPSLLLPLKMYAWRVRPVARLTPWVSPHFMWY